MKIVILRIEANMEFEVLIGIWDIIPSRPNIDHIYI